MRSRADGQRRARLETALRDRDDELRDLRQTMELNERAILRSLDDERRRWATERQLLQVQLLSAHRHGPPVVRSTVLRSPSSAVPDNRVVVVEPSQRPPPTVSRKSPETSATGRHTVNLIDAQSEMFRVSDSEPSLSSESSAPVDVGSRNASSDNSRNDPDPEENNLMEDRDQKLRLQVELCRQELADERRRWVDEKQVVVEYQLRLQTYCRQLAYRNQLLEDRLKTMSLELGRNGGSSGYSSDSAAIVLQFLDDSNLLTSSL